MSKVGFRVSYARLLNWSRALAHKLHILMPHLCLWSLLFIATPQFFYPLLYKYPILSPVKFAKLGVSRKVCRVYCLILSYLWEIALYYSHISSFEI